MFTLLRLFACDCTACPFKCDGTEARMQREALVQRLQFEETVGLILLAVIAVLIVMLIALIIRLVIIGRHNKQLGANPKSPSTKPDKQP